jgi:hypothetical protein
VDAKTLTRVIAAQDLPHPVARITRPHSGTYFGRRVLMAEALESGPLGTRTVFTYRIDDAHPRNGGYPAGTLTATTIRGDGRETAKVWSSVTATDFAVIVPTYIVPVD